MTLSAINVIVTEQLYSSLGQPICTTIPVVKGTDNIVGFIDTLIASRNPLDSTSSWVTGGALNSSSEVVNWAWANNTAITDTDRQYAYQGSFPENDPLQRKVQSSQPGEVFSIAGETGSANHSTSYTPGYLPEGVETTLPSLLFGIEGTTAPLYSQLTSTGSETSLGDIGNILCAQVKDFKGNTLAQATVDDIGKALFSSSLYSLGAQFSSSAAAPYMSATQLYLPNYYALSDTEQIISTDTNALGQSIAQTSHDAGTVLNYYDVYGRLRFSQTADQAIAGTVIYYLYDALNRLLESGFLAMAWDKSTFQALTSATDASQLSAQQLPANVTPQPLRQWEYDQAGAEASEALTTIGKIRQVTSWNTMPNGKNALVNPNSQLIEEYEYDSLGNCETFTQTFNTGTPYITNYSYDSLGRMVALTYPQAESSNTAFTVYHRYTIQNTLSALGTADNPAAFASYQYNEFGQVMQESLGVNGQEINYCYGNPLNQLTGYSDAYQLLSASLSYTDSSGNYQDGNIQQISYQFDTNILNLNNAPIQSYTYSYSYDTFGRLMAATAQNADNSTNSAWSMSNISNDANNNLQSYTLNNTTNTYAYPTGTNQVKNINGGTSFNYSDSGLTLSTPNSLSFTYDLLAPLPITVNTVNGTLSFIYDGRGERYQKSNGDVTLTYLRGIGSRPLVEMTTGTSSTTLYYVHGASGLSAINNGSTTYLVLKDHLGSARIVHQDVAASTLSASNIVGYYNYLPYGSLIADNSQQNSSLLMCRYLYTGQEWDSELGLYNYHARQYDPALGRFYTPDPAHHSASPYCYVDNNPVNAIDPSGQVPITITEVTRGRPYSRILAGTDWATIQEPDVLAARLANVRLDRRSEWLFKISNDNVAFTGSYNWAENTIALHPLVPWTQYYNTDDFIISETQIEEFSRLFPETSEGFAYPIQHFEFNTSHAQIVAKYNEERGLSWANTRDRTNLINGHIGFAYTKNPERTWRQKLSREQTGTFTAQSNTLNRMMPTGKTYYSADDTAPGVVPKFYYEENDLAGVLKQNEQAYLPREWGDFLQQALSRILPK
jgi:RHS repeat-associated protein